MLMLSLKNSNMALIIEVKVNRTKICTLAAENLSGRKTGVNAYRVYLLDANNKTIKESLVAHGYEDGAVKLVERVAKELAGVKLPK